MAAIGLFTLGTILILRGVNEATYYDGPRGRSMILLGSLCFLPEAMQATYCGGHTGHVSFKWSQIPSYDD